MSADRPGPDLARITLRALVAFVLTDLALLALVSLLELRRGQHEARR